jgi:hypothetical protein
MVNATVDNEPVSIILDGGQSTTVPSGEVWKVNIYLANHYDGASRMRINGIGDFWSKASNSSSNGIYQDVTLTGGDTIIEKENNGKSAIFITGFVVN